MLQMITLPSYWSWYGLLQSQLVGCALKRVIRITGYSGGESTNKSQSSPDGSFYTLGSLLWGSYIR